MSLLLVYYPEKYNSFNFGIVKSLDLSLDILFLLNWKISLPTLLSLFELV